MRRWGVIAIVLVAILVSGYVVMHGRVTSKIVWWSCPAQYHWQITREWEAPNLPDWQVVLLSCDYRKTAEGAGSGDAEPMYYAERGEWGGGKIVRIYLNVPVWWGVEPEKRARSLSYFVLSQIEKEQGRSGAAVSAYKSTVPPIAIGELMGGNNE